MSGASSFQRSARRVVLVVLVAVAVYFGLAVYSGIHKLAARLADFAWWTFGAALLLAFGNYLLRFLKWQFYLARLEIRGIPTLDSFLTFLSGFVLSVSPGKVGEVFKSYVLAETYDIPAQRTAPIVVAERLTDLIGVIVLIVLGSAKFEGGLKWAVAGSALVVSLIVLIAWRDLSLAILARIAKLPGTPGRLAPKFRDAYDSLYRLTQPSALVWPTLLSIAAWFLECLALWVVLLGFSRTPTVQGASFVYATSTLAGALVPVPGGLGVTEPLMKGLMREVCNVDEAAATGAMMLVRFATLWFAVVVGFVALSILRTRHPRLLADPEK